MQLQFLCKLLPALLACASISLAQSQLGTGSISGLVLDSSGQSVTGANSLGQSWVQRHVPVSPPQLYAQLSVQRGLCFRQGRKPHRRWSGRRRLVRRPVQHCGSGSNAWNRKGIRFEIHPSTASKNRRRKGWYDTPHFSTTVARTPVFASCELFAVRDKILCPVSRLRSPGCAVASTRGINARPPSTGSPPHTLHPNEFAGAVDPPASRADHAHAFQRIA